MNYNPSSLGGAYDLSSLVNRARSSAPSQSAGTSVDNTPAANGQPNTAAAQDQVYVTSLVLDVQPSELATFVKVSERVPVIVEFHTVRSQGSQELGKKLATEVTARGGELILVRIDGDHQQVGTLLKAFQVQQLPAVCVLLMGQPVPLFNGDQEPEVIKQVVDRVLILARENGVSELAIVDADALSAPLAPALPPRHKAAYEAIEAGDYSRAVDEFQAALNEAPADVVAAAGLAQAKLLLRTDGLDLEKVLASPAQELADVLQKADVLAVIGHFDQAFDAILTVFTLATKEDRDSLRTHLLELFAVAGADNPDVAKARLRLTNLLY